MRAVGWIPTDEDYRVIMITESGEPATWVLGCYFKHCVQDPVSGCWRYKTDEASEAATEQYKWIMPVGDQAAFLFAPPNLPALIDPEKPRSAWFDIIRFAVSCSTSPIVMAAAFVLRICATAQKSATLLTCKLESG